MDTRRTFLKTSAATSALLATTTATSAFAASDRIQMAIIGTGNRGGRVFDSLVRLKIVNFSRPTKSIGRALING